MKTTLVTALACALLAGCATQPASHPDLAEATANVAPPAWSVDAVETPATVDQWWSQFGDPVMHRLIDSVLTENLDIRAAAERVTQAESAVKATQSTLLPSLDATGLAADSRQNTPPPLGYVREAGFGVAASWTPDIFGGERLGVLAAQAQLKGRQASANQLRLALAASTASAYIDLRWAQAELGILQQNADIRDRALRLIRRRREFGLATTLDVARAQNQYDEIQARLPRARSAIEHQLSLLATLSGHTPEHGDGLADTHADIPVPAMSVPRMLPSSALLRRPDVSNAYAMVQARAAEVGVSKAQRYPQFSLSLTDGLLASSYLGLPTLTDNLFSAALSVTSPIFNAGRIDAGIAASESRMRESELALRQTMLDALKEIEDTRSDMLSASAQVASLNRALDASGQALRLSTELYKGGASSFLDVLSAQDSFLKDEDALNEARRDSALSAVALYRALGGGWQPVAVESSVAQASAGPASR